MPQETQTRVERKRKRVAALMQERNSWEGQWKDIAIYQMPWAARFLLQDTNNGKARGEHIYDNTAVIALRTLAAGMMAGMTSPARPWFRLSIRDKDLMQFQPVKAWLHGVTKVILAIFAQSNVYRVVHDMYGQLGAFGVASSVMLPDFKDVVRLYPFTIGEYALGVNDRGEVDTIAREFKMTVGQVVQQFGLENVSVQVKNLWDRSDYDVWVPVVHVIEPNRDVDRSSPFAKGKPFSSLYFEKGRDEGRDAFLRDAGFGFFPGLTPRWEVIGNDIYGKSPGMECRGDVKQLQHQQLRKAQGIDYQVNPPLQVPGKLREFDQARLPGGVAYVDSTGPGNGVKTLFEVNLNLAELGQDIMDVRSRIRSAYYADLFLMLANDTRNGITATEIVERHEEKMLMLGPVLERLHNEMLGPLVTNTFHQCVRADILPPAPKEIQGKAFDVEFISALAQAQKAVSSGSIDQVTSRVAQIAQFKPEVLDKINGDKIVDELADMYGIDPNIIVSDDQVAEARAQRAKMQQAQQAMAAAKPMADSAKALSAVDPDRMKELNAMFQGYGGPNENPASAM